ncbi:MAG: hypothetical protein J6L73_08285 [Muribaculaceae bacterium]|nr:hypothetical protein [Muribaculaceae bacterium]
MTKLFISIMLAAGALACPLACAADSDGKPDKVYLKSGETVTGYLQSQVPGESITYLTSDGQTLVIPVSNIKRIDRERHAEYSSQGLKSGYKGMYSFSFTAGTSKAIKNYKPNNRIELSTTQGYQFNPYLYAGIGFAWQYFYAGYHYSNDSFSLIPVFADVRWTPVNHRFSPIVDFKAGGFFGKMTGWYLQPSAGVRVAVNNKYGFDLTIGYTIQRITGDPLSPPTANSFYKKNKPKLDGVNICIAVDI